MNNTLSLNTNILPDEIFPDAAPLTEQVDAVNHVSMYPVRSKLHRFQILRAKNVQVSYHDFSTEIGLLHTVDMRTFIVGNNYRRLISEVNSFREV